MRAAIYARFSSENQRDASRHFGVAAAMSPTPRPAFLFWWMVAAARARDGAAFLAAFRAYDHHFAGSPGLRTACTMCASMVPVERGLQILGTVDQRAEPRTNFALALLLDRAGRIDEAVAAYRAGLAADPDNRVALTQLYGVEMHEAPGFAPRWGSP